MLSLDTDTAFRRYEDIRARLPEATYGPSAEAPHLGALADHYDGFVLDAFGVLNVGETAIPGAVERMAELRRAGKRLIVLTNAASYPLAVAEQRYRAFGFDFTLDEIVSSRAVAAEHLAPGHWAAIAAEGDPFTDLPGEISDLMALDDWSEPDGILFLSGARWSQSLQERLVEELIHRPRPVVIANPDLVAPRGDILSIEPGFWGHDIQDRTSISPEFYGKPYGAAFQTVLSRLGPGRYAMVGDTLHTDILGGRAAGMGTVLITRHGLFAGREVGPFIEASGIRPDWVVPTT